jgi:hypothetical protein
MRFLTFPGRRSRGGGRWNSREVRAAGWGGASGEVGLSRSPTVIDPVPGENGRRPGT